MNQDNQVFERNLADCDCVMESLGTASTIPSGRKAYPKACSCVSEVAAHHDAAKGRANLSSGIFARMTLPTKCPIFSDPCLQFKTGLNNSQYSNIPIYSTIFQYSLIYIYSIILNLY